jgi:hypothetical protein
MKSSLICQSSSFLRNFCVLFVTFLHCIVWRKISERLSWILWNLASWLVQGYSAFQNSKMWSNSKIFHFLLESCGKTYRLLVRRRISWTLLQLFSHPMRLIPFSLQRWWETCPILIQTNQYDHFIQNAIQSMKSNAVGLDGIPLKCIKLILPEIISPTVHIFYKTISSKTFPSAWKFSEIVPVSKVKDSSRLKNDRPIIHDFGKDHKGSICIILWWERPLKLISIWFSIRSQHKNCSFQNYRRYGDGHGYKSYVHSSTSWFFEGFWYCQFQTFM